jgi:hypothetical protein
MVHHSRGSRQYGQCACEKTRHLLCLLPAVDVETRARRLGTLTEALEMQPVPVDDRVSKS